MATMQGVPSLGGCVGLINEARCAKLGRVCLAGQRGKVCQAWAGVFNL